MPGQVKPASHHPIGVFDSGVGGLSVLREIHRLLPHESLCYVADSRHAPYGDKSPAFIEARATRLVEFFIDQGVKAVVVACNTVTGLVIQHLRQHFVDMPIVAIEPAIKPAARVTRNGKVGVLATRRTVDSPGLARLLETHANGTQMILRACPGWVERVEDGDLDSATTQAAVKEHVQPLLDQGADTLVLGCTHYPFLAGVVQQIAGPNVTVIDPAPAVARELARRLSHEHLAQTDPSQRGRVTFWTSGNVDQARRVMGNLWQDSLIDIRALPESYAAA